MRLLGVTAMSLLALVGCADPGGPGTGDPPGPDSGAPGTGAQLSDEERASLLFMREEEKLARDVYGALRAYGQVFDNIQASEQRHFDAVGGLLVTYGLDDPAAGMAPGAFTSAALQSLYDELVARGAPGQLAALGVGCTIEELDIRDLVTASDATTHADIATVYASLQLGSRNHLRSFYGQLVASGGSYTPVYLDQASFDAIVSSPREQGGN